MTVWPFCEFTSPASCLIPGVLNQGACGIVNTLSHAYAVNVHLSTTQDAPADLHVLLCWVVYGRKEPFTSLVLPWSLSLRLIKKIRIKRLLLWVGWNQTSRSAIKQTLLWNQQTSFWLKCRLNFSLSVDIFLYLVSRYIKSFIKKK